MVGTRKRSLALLLVLSLLVSVIAEAPLAALQEAAPSGSGGQAPALGAPRTVTLKEGAVLDLKFAQSLNSKTAVKGDLVEFVLDQDVKVGEDVVVRRGARILGRVTEGKESEKKRGAHEIKVSLAYLKAGDAKVKLRGEIGGKPKASTDTTVGLTVMLGLSGFLLARSLKHFEIKEGTPLKAYVAEDVELPVLPQ
jgi:hypothetical protein